MAIPSILTSPRPLTNLEAVNLCLEALGDRRVSREDQTTNSIKACTSIGRALMSVQSMGYDFSTSENVKYLPVPYVSGAPAGHGAIILGANIMTVQGYGPDGNRSFINRGELLYDLDRETEFFPNGKTVHLTVSRARPLIHLPAPASWYVALTAAIDFVGGLKPEDPVIRILAQTQQTAKINLENMDAKVRPGNLVTSSPHFNRIRGRNRRR